MRANFKQATTDDLVAAVGAGLVGAREVLTAVYPGLKQPRKSGGADVVPISRARNKAAKAAEGGRGKKEAGQIAIRGLIPGMAVHFARCCHPLPGDRIVGIITTGKGVTIHTIDCATLESFSEAPERWIDVGWDSVERGRAGVYTGRLKITVANQPGSLSSLSTVIARHEGNISQPAHRQPLDGFLRHGDRCRGGRREAPRRHHGGAARHARHQRRRTRP